MIPKRARWKWFKVRARRGVFSLLRRLGVPVVGATDLPVIHINHKEAWVHLNDPRGEVEVTPIPPGKQVKVEGWHITSEPHLILHWHGLFIDVAPRILKRGTIEFTDAPPSAA